MWDLKKNHFLAGGSFGAALNCKILEVMAIC
jgi:hypothetical protein